MLYPFFSYFGSKCSLARQWYPAPRYRTIVEPFAGSAGYSLRWHTADVMLYEQNPKIAGIWSYLIRSRREELLALPLFEGPDQRASDLNTPCEEARWLIGMWLNRCVTSPRNAQTAAMRDAGRAHPGSFWSAVTRERIANQMAMIRHWRVVCGDYEAAPPATATWFVDPPYEGKAALYPGCARFDHGRLAAWLATLRGQVILCESPGNSWWPYPPTARREKRGARGPSEHRVFEEAYWEWSA